jgi:hypothetical protein
MAASVSDLPVPETANADEPVVIGREGTAERIEVINQHRDERDVRMLLHLAFCGIVLVLLLLASLAANAWMYWRRPDRIVVDRRADGDHVILVNDQAVGSAVSMSADQPGADDKRRLANEWAMARYGIDPLAREQAVERLLRMMEPGAATKFVAYLKRNSELERERGERHQATWRPQLTVIDSSNPYRVNLVGTQELNRVVAGVPQRETRQIMFSLRLMPDKDAGRAEHNLFTGFLVTDLLDVREVTSQESAGGSVLPEQPPQR